MKSERVTLLTTKEFKRFLGDEAKREGVSVAELVRTRCQSKPGRDELVLAELTRALDTALTQAKSSLREGLEEAQEVLLELRSKHKQPEGRITSGIDG
jgi:hypothetical protein